MLKERLRRCYTIYEKHSRINQIQTKSTEIAKISNLIKNCINGIKRD
jgi:hypothetical protein